jgi:hypothetical protein
MRKRRRRVMGAGPPERWEPAAPSPRVVEAVEEQAPGAGAEASAVGRSTEEAARAAEASGSATVVTSAAASAPVEPSRKRKRGFSTLR